ncbi:uncharacterized protein [Diadema setosum]|uniref:uncharacterized protein n=1 Tax=Diadema antillarum TaxID=105358 RepID=UPI003A891319
MGSSNSKQSSESPRYSVPKKTLKSFPWKSLQRRQCSVNASTMTHSPPSSSAPSSPSRTSSTNSEPPSPSRATECPRNTGGQIRIVIDLARSYHLSTHERSNIRWHTSCQFAPFDDSRLVTCVGVASDVTGRRIDLSSTLYQRDDVVHVWSLDGAKNKCYSVRKRHNDKVAAHCRMMGDGRFICYAEGNRLVFRSSSNPKHFFLRDTLFQPGGVFKYCAVSSNDSYAAAIVQLKGVYKLYVFSTDFFLPFYGQACHEMYPAFLSDCCNSGKDSVECRFTPDGDFIAVSSSKGSLFLVRRQNLSLFRGVFPRLDSQGKSVALSGVGAYAFHPLFAHHLITCCTTQQRLTTYNLNTNSCTLNEPLVEDIGTPDRLSYNSEGTMIAVAGSKSRIAVFYSDTAQVLATLDTNIDCTHCALQIRNPVPGYRPHITDLSFSHDTSHIAGSSDDGLVRVWELPPTMDLQRMCRLAILRQVPAHKVAMLPLPPLLKSYIIGNPR